MTGTGRLVRMKGKNKAKYREILEKNARVLKVPDDPKHTAKTAQK